MFDEDREHLRYILLVGAVELQEVVEALGLLDLTLLFEASVGTQHLRANILLNHLNTEHDELFKEVHDESLPHPSGKCESLLLRLLGV